MSESDGEDGVKPVVFNYSFSSLEAFKSTSIPEGADALWQTIVNPGEPVKFGHLLHRITRRPNQNAILSAFGLAPPCRDILATELRRHLSYVNRIVPLAIMLRHISTFPLDMDAFIPILPSPNRELLACALHLLWLILSAIEDDVRHQTMERFGCS
jgi:hypothetical protein